MPINNPSLDAIAAATVYVAHGRTAQARDVLADAMSKDPSMRVTYGEQIAALERRLSAEASAREKQTQRLLLFGVAGFGLLVFGELRDWTWLSAAGAVMWVGAGLAVVLLRIRKT